MKTSNVHVLSTLLVPLAAAALFSRPMGAAPAIQVSAADTSAASELSKTNDAAPSALDQAPQPQPAVRFSAAIKEVLKLVDAKVGPDVIKAYINNYPYAYSATANEIVALKQRGVPSDIIEAVVSHTAQSPVAAKPAANAQPQPTPTYSAAPPSAPAGAEADYQGGAVTTYPIYYPVYYPNTYSYWWYNYGYPWYGCYGYPWYASYSYYWPYYGYGCRPYWGWGHCGHPDHGYHHPDCGYYRGSRPAPNGHGGYGPGRPPAGGGSQPPVRPPAAGTPRGGQRPGYTPGTPTPRMPSQAIAVAARPSPRAWSPGLSTRAPAMRTPIAPSPQGFGGRSAYTPSFSGARMPSAAFAARSPAGFSGGARPAMSAGFSGGQRFGGASSRGFSGGGGSRGGRH